MVNLSSIEQIGFCIIDEHNKLIEVSESYCQMLGYSKNDLLGMSIDNIEKTKPSKIKDGIKKTITADVVIFSTYLTKNNGSTIEVEIGLVYRQDPSGRRYYAFVHDISEISKYREAIKKNSLMYTRLVEASPDAIISIDEKMKIIMWNPAAERMFGYSKNEALGKDITLIIPPKYQNRHIEGVKRFLNTGKTRFIGRTVDLEGRRADGSIIPVELSLTAIHTDGDSFIFTGIIRDITDRLQRQKAEIEKYQIQAELEKTREIEKTKSEFTAMIVHDLKNPLSPILGYSEMLLENIGGDLNETQKDMLEKIYQNSKQLLSIIDRFVLVEKLDLGKISVEKDTVSIQKLMQDVVDFNTFLVKDTKIQLVNKTDTDISASVDSNKIHEVFSNLIKNAVDFVPEDSGVIEIGAKPQNKDVLFWVKDNGIGIPKEKQKNLFKKFYHVDSSIKRKHGGTGLGLAICRGLVEVMGGKIWVESEENKGASFYFTVPV